MKKILVLFLIVLMGCATSTEGPFQGKWQAKWTTDPAGYGELANEMKFEMEGSFEFDEENLTILAFGYEGCVFGSDTLNHTLTWSVRGDTLELRNNPEEPGIQYNLLSQTDSEINLQLVDDIFITLSK